MTLDELKLEHERILALPETATPTISNCPNMGVLRRIHSKNRNYLETALFSVPCKICQLDFLGAPDYIVSENGLIWNRNRMFSNCEGLMTKDYLPLSVMDSQYSYPWVKLQCALNSIDGAWIPLNLIMAWAFKPVVNIGKYFAINSKLSNNSLSANALYWSTEPSMVKMEACFDSKYLDFLNFLYTNV